MAVIVYYVRFEVATSVQFRIQVTWNMMLCHGVSDSSHEGVQEESSLTC